MDTDNADFVDVVLKLPDSVHSYEVEGKREAVYLQYPPELEHAVAVAEFQLSGYQFYFRAPRRRVEGAPENRKTKRVYPDFRHFLRYSFGVMPIERRKTRAK